MTTFKKQPDSSDNYYVRNTECPACGARRSDFFTDRKDEVSVELQNGLVHVNCRLCGKYKMTKAAFKFLGRFENKARLSVFLFTRTHKKVESDFAISPKLLKENLKLYST